MKKALAFGALAVVIVFTWGLLALGGLDFLARLALQRWGAELAGASVEVERVSLSVFKGDASLAGLELGNPPGFSARTAHVGRMQVRLDPGTLTSGVTLVHELAVQGMQVTYERGERGSNLDAIQRNIEDYVKRGGTGQARDAAGKSSPKRRYIVERLTLRNVKVRVTHPKLGGQAVAFDLPDVDLRDVGKGQGGLTAGQVAGLVTAQLQQRIAVRLLSNIDALRRGGLEGAIDALRNLVR